MHVWAVVKKISQADSSRNRTHDLWLIDRRHTTRPPRKQCGTLTPRITSIDWRWSNISMHALSLDFHYTSSVKVMLTQLQWPTLQERRAQFKMVMMYRITYHQVDTLQPHLIPNVMSLRGHHQQFRVPFARTLIYQKTFPDAIRMWKSLPADVVQCTSFEHFKREVQHIKLR